MAFHLIDRFAHGFSRTCQRPQAAPRKLTTHKCPGPDAAISIVAIVGKVVREFLWRQKNPHAAAELHAAHDEPEIPVQERTADLALVRDPGKT